jgi:histone H3/H4
MKSRQYVIFYDHFLTVLSNVSIVVALREIWWYQKFVETQISKLFFQWLIHEITLDVDNSIKQFNKVYHWQSSAIKTLQKTAEMFLIVYLEDNILHIDIEIDY